VQPTCGLRASLVHPAASMNVEDFEKLCEGLSSTAFVRSADRKELPKATVSERDEFVHALYREVLYRRQPRLPWASR
jgi:hypothetical protein